ncbi:MAG: PHP domain-containing protein [Candidatus Thorarchaeota archaeon]
MPYDLHIHSVYSDGNATIGEIADRAEVVGLETIGITDHFWPCLGSQRGGMGIIKARRRDIMDARQQHPGMRVLDAAEVDILSDGSLATIAGGLAQFDLIIGSFHWSADSTIWVSALLRALKKPQFQILGHWDGYLTSFNERDGRLAAEALARSGVAIELSVRYPPNHLRFLEMAREYECIFTLGSDSHSVRNIGQLTHLSDLARNMKLSLADVDDILQ